MALGVIGVSEAGAYLTPGQVVKGYLEVVHHHEFTFEVLLKAQIWLLLKAQLGEQID